MFSWLRKAAKPAQAQKTDAPADRVGDSLTSRCRELGVEAALSEIAGISPPMLVALGENGIKTVEDLAGCATDDLHGWVEQTSGTTTRHAGVLDGFGLSRDECGAIIMILNQAPPARRRPFGFAPMLGMALSFDRRTTTCPPMCNRIRGLKEWSDIPRTLAGKLINFEYNPKRR